MKRSLLLLALATFGVDSLLFGQTPAPDSFLVRRTTHVDDEYVIFRDGLVIGSVRTPDRTQVFRAQGAVQTATNLQRFLSQNRFGSEPGRCFYNDQPGQGDIFPSAVTWFERTGQRKVTLPFGSSFSALCSQTFIRSIRAIEDAVSLALHSPGAQFEDLPAEIFGIFKSVPAAP